MSEPIKLNGSCLCGKVKVAATTAKANLGVCHCNMCRTWTGGVSMVLDCDEKVSIEGGEDSLGIYSSSDWAERGFCKNCGTSLFYRTKDNPHYYVQSGLFSGLEDFVFSEQVFIDEKPTYYEFVNKTHNMTGQEIFEAFAPKE